MGGHVFMSYSRDDKEYVDALCDALDDRGIDCWSDAEIPTATSWVSVIKERLDSSAAVVVVMSPDGEGSPWVGREIDQAENKERPIFPLLLRGERFFRLADLQYEDVRNGRLPSEAWFRTLGRVVGVPEPGDELPSEADAQAEEEPGPAEVDEQAAERRRAEEEELARQRAEEEAARRRAEEEELARQRAEEEEERRQAEEEEELARQRAEEEEERRRRRRQALLIGGGAAAAVVAAVVIIIAVSGGGGGGDGAQTVEVAVPGDQNFTETDVDCDAGASLAISAEGTVFHNDETGTGPDGDPSVPAEFSVVPDIAHAALIGRIGDEGAPFLVGSSVAGTCPAAGQLFLGVNDAGPGNNSGEFVATVEVQPAS